MKNSILTQLVSDLKALSIKENVKIWKRVAEDLEKPSRQKREVSIDNIAKTLKKGEIAVIPGKVLGKGKFDGEIAAYQFSQSAREGNKTLSLYELIKKNPKGNKCRVMG